MGAEKIYKSILRTTAAYEAMLDGFDPEGFQVAPPIGGWSYSEVYCHIFDASLLSMVAINECVSREGRVKPTVFLVKAILFMGVLPPGVKYRVPPKLAGRVRKIDIATARQFIIDFKLQLTATEPKLRKADPKIKVKHPVMGYLNAVQWLRFAEIHLEHHFKQLNRIKNSLT